MLQFDEQDNLDTNSPSVNSLLPIDEENELEYEDNEDLEEKSLEEEDEDPAKTRTKHDFVTSPWSRLGIIGGAFGIGFLVMFLALNTMMSGGGNKKAEEQKVDKSQASSANSENKDGEILSKLALQKQQQELEALNGKKREPEVKEEEEEKPEKNSKTEEKAKKEPEKADNKPPKKRTPREPQPARRTQYAQREPQTRPAPRRVAQRSNPEPAPTPRRVAQTPPPAPRQMRQASTANTSTPRPSQTAQVKATDPIAELERLRMLGNLGRIEYAALNSPTATPSRATSRAGEVETSALPVSEEATSPQENSNSGNRRRSNRRPERNQTPSNNNNIEQLRPRWEPTEVASTEGQTESQTQAQQVNFSEEEAILQEKTPQYLVVGEYTQATLDTPLIFAQGNQEQANNLRFIARLSEPLYSNTNEVAIEGGTEVVISVMSVDNSSHMRAEVTAILKDGTEYPISPGSISVLGKEGNPLIASPHNDKGDAIAGYDTTLGIISGIAKVGEIMNEPEEEITEDLPLGGSRSRRRNGNRNMGGAFLEGFFGSVSEVIGKRNERATEEILSRPNIWFVPKNTEITIQVNKSIKL
ncbi:MAG: hypothetical protein KME64_37660 [Scytonematopsis contorta HA4267-MV1]|jgi:hypothetical protein|nr:hypothetical protein [Scytonematopsis contorta HA4267-MV1]